MTGRLLTTREAADYLHVRPETLLAWDRSGKLRGFRISTNALRWDPAEIEAFLRGTREIISGSPSSIGSGIVSGVTSSTKEEAP